jgi:hypothetical protein
MGRDFAFPVRGDEVRGVPPRGAIPFVATDQTAWLFDEFRYISPNQSTGVFSDMYETANGIVAGGGGLGNIQLDSNSVVAGESGTFATEGGFEWSTPTEFWMKQRVNLQALTANQMIALGAMTNQPSGQTTRASLLTALNNSIGFIFNSTDSPNWHAYTVSAGTSTLVDTGVAGSTSKINLEMIMKTRGLDTIIYYINNEVVAQITTNKTIASSILTVDMWEFQVNRF